MLKQSIVSNEKNEDQNEKDLNIGINTARTSLNFIDKNNQGTATIIDPET